MDEARVTIDGIGETHDATRRLAGGGPTFGRIIANLGEVRLPFRVSVRNNLHETNVADVEALRSLCERLSATSGNAISYHAAMVSENEVADERGEDLGLLRGSQRVDVAARIWAAGLGPGRGHYCRAHSLWNVTVDERGRLHKCWDTVDKPGRSFGTARDWDPADPLASAECADNMTAFLNTACPIGDDECRTCVWLPMCAGGCPYKRLLWGRSCVPFKDEPERFIWALHERRMRGRNR